MRLAKLTVGGTPRVVDLARRYATLNYSTAANPDRTIVTDGIGAWLATFTTGARTVALAGSPRTFTQTDLPISDDFNRTRSTTGWGPATIGGGWTHNGGTVPGNYTVAPGAGRIDVDTENASRRCVVGSYDVADADILTRVTVNKAVAGAAQGPGVMLGYQDPNNHYMAEVELLPSGTVTLRLRIRSGGTSSNLTSPVTISGLAAPAAGTALRIRASLSGGALRAKVWLASGAEPANWQIGATDTTFPAGKVGVRAYCGTGTTNLPVRFTFTDFSCTGYWPNPPTIIHSTDVRLLPAPFAGTVDVAWLTAALNATTPDLLELAMQYVSNAPAVVNGATQIGGDAGYGPIDATGGRAEGSDWNDYLGVTATYSGTNKTADPTGFRMLDCSGFIRMVYGYRGGMALSLTQLDGVKIPRTSRDISDSGPGVSIFGNVGAVPSDLTRLQIGDLVSFDATSGADEDVGEIDHIGIYMGIDTVGLRRFISSRKTPNGPTFSDTAGPSTIDGSYLYSRSLRAVRRF